MRIERTKLGVKVAVLFNRSELREITKQILLAEEMLPSEAAIGSSRGLPVYLGNRKSVRNTLYITVNKLEPGCKNYAKSQIEIPSRANFIVGVNPDGLITRAVFKWREYEGHEF